MQHPVLYKLLLKFTSHAAVMNRKARQTKQNLIFMFNSAEDSIQPRVAIPGSAVIFSSSVI